MDKKITQHKNDIVFGINTAPHTIFLYASYNCRYCRFLFSRTFPELEKQYVNNGKIKVVIKFVELSENPHSLYALKAASCIYKFGHYKPLHKLLLTNPSVVATNEFDELINDIMAENDKIAECILSNNDYLYLKHNISEFRGNKLSGTPCMIINNHVYSGFMSYENLNKVIKKEFNL